MAITVPRGEIDEIIRTIISGALEGYNQAHPQAEIEIYRQNSVSIRIKVVDPDLEELDKSDRHDEVWEYLGQLPEEIQSDISMLVLLAPEEAGTSMANWEFDDPLPSRL